MILHDYQCETCGTFDSMVEWDELQTPCPKCGAKCSRIYTCRGALHEAPAWVKESMKVIDKSDPEARKLLDTGSRSDLHQFMKKKGIRFMEDGEKVLTNKDRERQADIDHARITEEVVNRHIQRNRIEVYE